MEPDPKFDSILCIAIAIAMDDEIIHQIVLLYSDQMQHEKLTRNDSIGLKCLAQEIDNKNTEILSFDSKLKLLNAFIRTIRFYDCDIIIGWEIQKQSLGYIIDKAMHLNNIDIIYDLNRILKPKHKSQFNRKDEWGMKKASGIHIIGRILLNLWRCCRSEIKLNSYTKENVVFNLLNEKIAKISYSNMCKWYKSCTLEGGDNYYFYPIILKYLLQITTINFDIISEIDLIGRTSDLWFYS